jgi:excisionase family DNA binding protein
MNGSPDLALVLADPQRAADLRPDEIPSLLGMLERVRAALWAQMVRAPAVVRPETSSDGHELLTVPEVAAELRFTRGYIYEAVRRGELPAVRKGKYVRLRRADLEAWLGGRAEARLDAGGRLPHSALPRRGSRAAARRLEPGRPSRPGPATSRSRAKAPHNRSDTLEPRST